MQSYSIIEKKPNLIYYNASMVNSKFVDDGTPDPFARFEEENPKALISNPSEWEFSVIRFTSECGLNLPILIFQVVPSQSNINLGIYSITLSGSFAYTIDGASGSTTIVVQQPLIWVPENQNAVVPASPVSSVQDLHSEYYWLFTYSHFCDIVNTAFKSAMTTMQSQFNSWVTNTLGKDPTNLSTKAPFIKFNNSTNLFSIYYDNYGFGADRTSAGSSTAGENITLYFDSNLYALLGNFKSLYSGNDNNQGMAYQMVVTNDLGVNNYTYSGDTYYVMTQDYSSLSTIWSPISSIAFKSKNLPIASEYASNPVSFDSSNVNSIVQSNNLVERIITDISLPLDYPHQYRELLNYTPNGEYRMISMIGNQSVNVVDLSVHYRLKMTGELIPIRMPNQSCVTAKLMFRRRLI